MGQLIIIIICLLLNAIFSCIEMAFVVVSRPHLKQLASNGSKAAQRILFLKRNPERALSVLQIGITLVGAISAAVTGTAAEHLIGPQIIAMFQVEPETAAGLAIGLIVLPLTYFSVVIGELVPKSLALRFPMRFALSGGIILIVLDRFFAPFVFLLEISTKFFTHIIFARLRPEHAADQPNLIDIDPLSESHKQYVFNLINVDKRTVRDIMIPWEKMATVSIGEHYHDVLEKIKTCRHTRLPVCNDGKIVGLLHTKEYMAEAEISKIDWTQLIRPILKMNPTEPILNALKKLQIHKNHMALVYIEGEPAGAITIEDIFEEVVGEIFDEDDDPKTLLSTNSIIRTMNLKSGKK
ncbi:MAG: HlyC/CorC family transporter [Bdellovibrionaceae bacterium]|nr:HlyC/CorC family transporter [Bdellovibrio sp.]